MKKLLCLFLCCVLCLSFAGCQEAEPEPERETVDLKQYLPENWPIKPESVEHGEDYVIEWEDAGIEAYIRYWLDRPEGDIRHSDVWNLRFVDLDSIATPDDGMIKLTFLEEPLDGGEVFNVIYGGNNVLLSPDVEMPKVESLRDLRHFDSLQIFTYWGTQGIDVNFIDISGAEECRNLTALRLWDVQLETLEPVREMERLKYLSIDNVSFKDYEPVDLSPLENHPSLIRLDLVGTDVVSVEPLATTKLECLCMVNSFYDKERYDHVDMRPLAQIKTLVDLDMSNHNNLDVEMCQYLLENLDRLQRMRIVGAGAYTNGLGTLQSEYPDVIFDK